jgi:sortase A
MLASATSWVRRLLLLVGLSCLVYVGYVTVSAAVFQRHAKEELEALRTEAGYQPASFGASLPRPVAPVPAGADVDPSLIGLLEIPRLGISTPVLAGDDKQALELGIGHLPDTPRPWEPGNSAVAAHRDTVFRPLKDVRIGDLITLRTLHGDFEYQVRQTKIVQPTDLSVLTPLESDALTLITCYPFYYVGSAPQRFIVQAMRTGGATTGDIDVLPSRSAVRLARYSTDVGLRPSSPRAARYSASPARTNGQKTPPRHSTAAGVRHGELSRARVSGGQRVSSSAVRAKARRADTAAPQRDRRQRDTASGDRRQGPHASGRDGRKDDRPAKTRRWYHFFQRRG